MNDRTSQPSSLARSLASSWLALGVGVIVSFLLSPYVVGKIGAAWYGVWALAGQSVGYLYLLDFGVRESIIRYTSKYAARRQGAPLHRVLSTAITIYGVIALVTLGAVALCAWGVPHWFDLEPAYWHDARWAIVLAGLTVAQTFVFNVFTGVVLGLRRWDISNALGIGWNLLRAAAIVLFLSRGYGIVAIAAIQCGISLLSGLTIVAIAVVQLRRRGLPFRLAFVPHRKFRIFAQRILSYGFYVIVNNIGEKLILASDAVVVGIFLPVQSVAYYAIGGSLISYMRSLLSSTAQVFNPLASHLKTLRQGKELQSAFLLGVKINMLIVSPIAATFVVLGGDFIGLWMGREFAGPSGEVLAVLAVAAFFAAPQYIFSSVLYGISRHRIMALLRIAEAIVNLGLSIALVRTIGLPGVALGTAIPSAIMVGIVLPVVACRVVGVSLPVYYAQAYLRPLGSVAPFVAAAWWMRDGLPAGNLFTLFAQIGGLTLLYLPCAYVLVLNAHERALIRGRFRWRAGRG